MKIEGNSIFSEDVIRAIIGLQKGDIANGEKIGKSLFENLKKYYGAQGFIEYTAEPTPTFKDNPQKPDEGIVDFVITIEEGKQFALRRLEFIGNTFTRDNVLRREVLLNEGDIYNQSNWEYSVIKLNQLGYFDPIDKDKDADFKTNEEEANVDITLKVTEKGRQQISFNGGLSGIGGSFFGLEYSTNNLLGRGEILSLNLSAGNRQKYLQFSFTEPYLKNRPITAGFSLFGFTQQFFGEGTFLSSNTAAQQGLSGSQLDFLNVSEENLFTRTSYGGTLFVSSPLSEFYRKRRFTQFSRVGASYALSTSSVKDPAVNQGTTCGTGGSTNVSDNPQFIPVIYCQPDIITSRITLTFTYDTRNASVDPTMGREISVAGALAGLGGDVRTYQPTFSYTQFFPVRRKKSEHPEVFGFRIIAGTVGSFAETAKVKNSNSLAFVYGVPIFERYFLGDEFTIRGYNVRSITPLAPIQTFITSSDVTLLQTLSARRTSFRVPDSAAAVGVFTGISGNNVARVANSFTAIGADTQILGNFEYRVPVVGSTVQVAAFLDIGSAFNIRSKQDQFFSSNFLPDQPFLSSVGFFPCPRSGNGLAAVSLSTLAACVTNPDLAIANGFGVPGLVLRGNRLVTTTELEQAQRQGPVDPNTGLPFGMQQVFLRGQAQTNTAVRVSDSLFAKIGDFQTSMGVEVRVQVPVINVPFRLIFAYNPRARPNRSSTEFRSSLMKKFTPRFSVGRTF